MRIQESLREGWPVVLALVGGLALAGCDGKLDTSMVGNQKPTIALTSAPVDTTQQYFYVVRAHWLGFDPDGQVTYYEYSVLDAFGSPDTITTWLRTTKNDSTFLFRCTTGSPSSTRLTDRHTLVVRAVDNEGMRSDIKWRTFFSYTTAPEVRILSPSPSPLLVNKVPPSIFITWEGDDFDGEFNKKPLKYKFKLYNINDPAINPNDPSTFNQFAPTFAPWDSVSGDTTFRLYTDLVPGAEYIFAITAFDEAGAYTPIFSRSTNVLRFLVTLAGSLGPHLIIFNEFIEYFYQSGGYSTDDSRRIRVEIPANTSVVWNWFAIPDEGALTRRTRWKLDDVYELTDETPRTNEQTDLFHWSRWLTVGQVRDDAVSIRLPGFPGAACNANTSESHSLYIEVEDNIGLRSLGIVEFLVVRPCFDRPMLIVDDRRGLPDQFRSVAGQLVVNPPPATVWPTESELDTFLFAVGNVPWKGYGPVNGLPTQLNSPPGVFAGYDYDTTDTRQGLIDLTYPLSVLSHYRKVAWFIDANSAATPISNGALDLIQPLTSLVWMNSPNRPNTLSIYSRQGGDLMIFGGGVVLGTVFGWQQPSVGTRWSSSGARPALVPGRFVYDILKMQTTVESKAGTAIQPHPARPAEAAALVTMLLKRGRDPLPPFRTTGQLASTATVEIVTEPLFIFEDVDGNPDTFDEVSVLDTLFAGTGGVISPPDPRYPGAPAGFYYKSAQTPPRHGTVIFLGFDMWSWTRNTIITNMDVLMTHPYFWGLTRRPVTRDPALTASRVAPRK